MWPRLERAVCRTTEEQARRLLDKRDRGGVSNRRGARYSHRTSAGRQNRQEVDDDGPDAGLCQRMDHAHLRGYGGAVLRDRQDRDRRLWRHVLRPGTYVLRGDLRETDQRYIYRFRAVINLGPSQITYGTNWVIYLRLVYLKKYR